MQIQIDQDRSIVLPFSPSPIVHAQIVNRGYRRRRCRFLPIAAQHGIVAGDDRQPGQQSMPCTAARHVADDAHDF
jgi:hypothetical protein